MSTSGTGRDRVVRRIGKQRRVHEAEMAGEFAGHLGPEAEAAVRQLVMG